MSAKVDSFSGGLLLKCELGSCPKTSDGNGFGPKLLHNEILNCYFYIIEVKELAVEIMNSDSDYVDLYVHLLNDASWFIKISLCNVFINLAE